MNGFTFSIGQFVYDQIAIMEQPNKIHLLPTYINKPYKEVNSGNDFILVQNIFLKIYMIALWTAKRGCLLFAKLLKELNKAVYNFKMYGTW